MMTLNTSSQASLAHSSGDPEPIAEPSPYPPPVPVPRPIPELMTDPKPDPIVAQAKRMAGFGSKNRTSGG